MKLFTTKSLNLVFTVKKGSDTSDLIEVARDDVFEALIAKGLDWPVQTLVDENYSLILVAAECDDPRISRTVDICHQDNLSESCQEVLSVGEKPFLVNKASRLLQCSYDTALKILDEVCNSKDIEQDFDAQTTYYLDDGSKIKDNNGVLIAVI